MVINESFLPIAALLLFFCVAWLYASVGHGGASGYHALFALLGIAGPALVPVALVLNILVASLSWGQYRRSGFFRMEVLKPFILTSIPASFAAGMIDAGRDVFSLLLGAALLFSAWRLFFRPERIEQLKLLSKRDCWVLGLPAGALLGAVSGVIGIGGGIFLSPLLLLFRWTDLKQTAAISSAFIVLNSVSGLCGNIIRGADVPLEMLPLCVVVCGGGWLGARAGALRLHPQTIRVILALVLVFACGKLLETGMQ